MGEATFFQGFFPRRAVTSSLQHPRLPADREMNNWILKVSLISTLEHPPQEALTVPWLRGHGNLSLDGCRKDGEKMIRLGIVKWIS